MLAGDHGHVAAMPAVAAAGTTARDEFLAAEGHAAVAAIARFYVDFYFVDEQRAEACPGLFRGADTDELAQPAPVTELYNAADLGENRVVFADAGIFTGLETRSALPDDDGSAGHQLAAKHLHAQTLRIRIAAVFGTA